MFQDVHQVVDERLIEFARPSPARRIRQRCEAASLPGVEPAADGIAVGAGDRGELIEGKALRRQQNRVCSLALAVGRSLLMQMLKVRTLKSRQKRKEFHADDFTSKLLS